jgi:WD40 repeat protein
LEGEWTHNRTTKVWNALTGDLVASHEEFGHQGRSFERVQAVHVSPDGRWLFAAGGKFVNSSTLGGMVRIRSLRDGKQDRVLEAHESPVRALAFDDVAPVEAFFGEFYHP